MKQYRRNTPCGVGHKKRSVGRGVDAAMRRVVFMIAPGLLGISPSLSAQSQVPVLEEVIVSAQMRTESLQDVAVAVSAITGDDLANTGFRDIGDIASQVPSLSVTTNQQPMNTSFRIRGIGNEGNIPTFEPAVALIVDGAFRSRSAMGLGDMVDVTSVEVLKGPQSTLYGKNAGAGVISVTTQHPTDEFGGFVEASYGKYGYEQMRASLNMPVTERFATRFGISRSKRDPLTDNLLGDDFESQDGLALRGQFLYDFTDRLSGLLILGRLHRDLSANLGETYQSPAQISLIEAAGGQVTNNDPMDRVVEQPGGLPFDQAADDAVLTFNFQGSGFTVTSITAWDEYEADSTLTETAQTPLRLLRMNDTQAGESFSQELRIASDTGSDLSWLLGAFYYDNNLTRGDRGPGQHEFVLREDIEEYGDAVAEAILGIPTPVDMPILGVAGDTGDFFVEQDTESLALFSQVDYSLNSSLEVGLGLRYSQEKKSGFIEQSNQTSAMGCGPFNANLVCAVAPDGDNFNQSDSWSALTGNVGVNYYATEGTMLYALYSRGFKAGGYSLQFGKAPNDIRPFDEETISHIELGWKSEIWGRRARVNGAIFHTNYENFQNASFVSAAFAVNNAPEVVVDGIEVDSEWLLTSNLTAKLNLAYIDAVFEDYEGGLCYYGRSPENAMGQCDFSGESLPFTAKLTGNIALQWEQPLQSGDLYARLDYRYNGKANYSAELDPRHEKDAYAVGNFRLGWRNARFDVAGWVQNVTDEQYVVQNAPANITTSIDTVVGSPVGSYQSYLGEPRTYGATVRVFF